MRRYKFFVVFGIMVAVGFGVSFLVSFGYYPIAMVNGKIMNEREFQNRYRVASTYYGNFLTTYKQTLENDIKTLLPDEVRAAVLTELIENQLIHDEVQKELGSDFKTVMEAKISKFRNDPQLRKAALTLYGVEFPQFEEEVLVPQAEREILTGRLFLAGGNITDWLRDAKQKSKIRLFSGRFLWNGERVVEH